MPPPPLLPAAGLCQVVHDATTGGQARAPGEPKPGEAQAQGVLGAPPVAPRICERVCGDARRPPGRANVYL